MIGRRGEKFKETGKGSAYWRHEINESRSAKFTN